MGANEHQCEWREKAERLEADLGHAARALDAAEKIIALQKEELRIKDESLATMGEELTAVQTTVEKLQRHVFGPRSEKLPTVAEALRDPAKAEAARIAALRKRRENIEKRR